MSVQSVALASLTATYTDSDGEDGVDEEHEDNTKAQMVAGPHNNQVCQPHQVPISSPKSGRSASNSPNIDTIIGDNNKKIITNLSNISSTLIVNDVITTKSKVQRLVSYFDDTVVSDDEGNLATVQNDMSSNDLNNLNGIKTAKLEPLPSLKRELISDAVNDNENECDYDGIVIPSEPLGQCPIELQEKITILFRKMESGGLDMNKLIQQRKDFRNPSIYEKLIQFCSINELGTNYQPERFDPFKWGKDSYYEELAKVQKMEMDKLEKARKEKTKIEIVSGTAKRPNSSTTTAEDDAKKRKSKWDQVATGTTTTNVKPTLLLSQPTLTTITSSASGAKATVISAFGSLPKKRL